MGSTSAAGYLYGLSICCTLSAVAADSYGRPVHDYLSYRALKNEVNGDVGEPRNEVYAYKIGKVVSLLRGHQVWLEVFNVVFSALASTNEY